MAELQKFTVFVARPDWLEDQTGTGVNLWPVRVEAMKAREAAGIAINKVIEDDVAHGWLTEDEADDEYSNYRAEIVIRGHVDVAAWGFEL